VSRAAGEEEEEEEGTRDRWGAMTTHEQTLAHGGSAVYAAASVYARSRRRIGAVDHLPATAT